MPPQLYMLEKLTSSMMCTLYPPQCPCYIAFFSHVERFLGSTSEYDLHLCTYIYIYIYWVVKTLELHYNNIYICVHLCTYIYIYLYICVHFILSLSRVVVNQWLGWWVMIWVAVWLRFGFWWWCLSFGVLVFGVDDFGVLMVVVGGWFLVFQFCLGVSCCGWLVSCFGG